MQYPDLKLLTAHCSLKLSVHCLLTTVVSGLRSLTSDLRSLAALRRFRSSALLTLHDDEPGSNTVAELLEKAESTNISCLGCFISLMKVLYRVWRDEGEVAGRLAYEQCLALPINKHKKN